MCEKQNTHKLCFMDIILTHKYSGECFSPFAFFNVVTSITIFLLHFISWHWDFPKTPRSFSHHVKEMKLKVKYEPRQMFPGRGFYALLFCHLSKNKLKAFIYLNTLRCLLSLRETISISRTLISPALFFSYFFYFVVCLICPRQSRYSILRYPTRWPHK